MARKPETSAVELKSATLEAMRALLRSADTGAIAAALDARLGAMPGFFSGEPVVIDCSELPPGATPDLGALRDALGRHALTAVAVQAADEATAAAAGRLGLAVLAAEAPSRAGVPAEPAGTPATVEDRPLPEPETTVPADNPAEPQTSLAAPRHTEIIDKPLRSGQRIYARGDLIVLAMVSAGAEVIADGHIHVYAPLRGRALAGASGDTEARILTTCFEAELVSIAGVYKTFEHSASGDLLRKPVQIRLEQHPDKQVLSVAALATT